MEKLVQTVKHFWNDESGVTAVEYAILVAVLGGAILAAAQVLGPAIKTAFTNTSTTISGAGAGASGG